MKVCPGNQWRMWTDGTVLVSLTQVKIILVHLLSSIQARLRVDSRPGQVTRHWPDTTQHTWHHPVHRGTKYNINNSWFDEYESVISSMYTLPPHDVHCYMWHVSWPSWCWSWDCYQMSYQPCHWATLVTCGPGALSLCLDTTSTLNQQFCCHRKIITSLCNPWKGGKCKLCICIFVLTK